MRYPELVPVLSLVRDATWWIANKDAPIGELRWPSREQTAGDDQAGDE
jgi:hypothetical protein